MKKHIAIAFAIIILIGLFATQGSLLVQSDSDIAYLTEENEISESMTINSFADDTVLLVLHESATFNKHTAESFPEVECLSVQDLTEQTGKLIQRQLAAERSRNWGELKIHVDNNMLVDIKSFRKILSLKLKNKGTESVLSAIDLLNKREDVFHAAPDYILSGTSAEETDTNTADDWWCSRISINGAWDNYSPQESVLVGVLDGGFNGNSHPALAGRIDEELSDQFPGGGGNHGRTVAGIIALTDPNATFVSLTFLDTDALGNINGNCSTAISAIDFAQSKAIPILNMSAGWGDGGGKYFLDGDKELLETAIGQYSGLFIGIAGNYGNDNDSRNYYPAAYDLDNLIIVGASDNNDIFGRGGNWSSGYGATTVDLFAPGAGIDIGWGNMSGTSFAAPFVTGVASMIKAQYPGMTPAQIKAAIIDNVDGPEDGVTAFAGKCVSGGRLNAYKALKNAHVYDLSDEHLDFTVQVSCIERNTKFAAAGEFKDYYVTFSTSGTKYLQFTGEGAFLQVFNSSGTLINSSSSPGAVVSFNTTANAAYRIRLGFDSQTASGDAKLGIYSQTPPPLPPKQQTFTFYDPGLSVQKTEFLAVGQYIDYFVAFADPGQKDISFSGPAGACLEIYNMNGTKIGGTNHPYNAAIILTVSAAGTQYRIKISSPSAAGTVTLSIGYVPPLPKQQTFTFYDFGVTIKKTEALAMGQYIDYFITFADSGPKEVSFSGSAGTYLEIFSMNGTKIGGTYNHPYNATIPLTVSAAGTQYRIKIGFNSPSVSGTVILNISYAPPYIIEQVTLGSTSTGGYTWTLYSDGTIYLEGIAFKGNGCGVTFEDLILQGVVFIDYYIEYGICCDNCEVEAYWDGYTLMVYSGYHWFYIVLTVIL